MREMRSDEGGCWCSGGQEWLGVCFDFHNEFTVSKITPAAFDGEKFDLKVVANGKRMVVKPVPLLVLQHQLLQRRPEWRGWVCGNYQWWNNDIGTGGDKGVDTNLLRQDGENYLQENRDFQSEEEISKFVAEVYTQNH